MLRALTEQPPAAARSCAQPALTAQSSACCARPARNADADAMHTRSGVARRHTRRRRAWSAPVLSAPEHAHALRSCSAPRLLRPSCRCCVAHAAARTYSAAGPRRAPATCVERAGGARAFLTADSHAPAPPIQASTQNIKAHKPRLVSRSRPRAASSSSRQSQRRLASPARLPLWSCALRSAAGRARPGARACVHARQRSAVSWDAHVAVCGFASCPPVGAPLRLVRGVRRVTRTHVAAVRPRCAARNAAASS